MACSTCHVIVGRGGFEKLPRASEEEEDMLDLAANVTRTSRLACQIWLGAELQSLTVRMPAESRNMMNRCAPCAESRQWPYGARDSGGRRSRQPGQIRKEAAVTSSSAG